MLFRRSPVSPPPVLPGPEQERFLGPGFLTLSPPISIPGPTSPAGRPPRTSLSWTIEGFEGSPRERTPVLEAVSHVSNYGKIYILMSNIKKFKFLNKLFF